MSNFSWNVPLVSNFLEEVSGLSHSLAFLCFFALITEEGFLISPCYSLELCIQMLIFPFILCLLLLFFSQLFVRPPQTAILPFSVSFPWGWSWSLSPVQRHKPLSIVLQALCLLDLTPWIYLSLPLYNRRDLIRSYPNGPLVFPTFFYLSLNLAIRSLWPEPQSAPSLVFANCIERASLYLAAKNIINLISVLTIWWCPRVESPLVLLKRVLAMTSAFS